METVLAAAISGVVTLVVCLITNHAQAKTARAEACAEAEKTRALIDYRLSELEKKQDKHNSLMERTYKLEGQMVEVQHEVVDLKKFHQPN